MRTVRRWSRKEQKSGTVGVLLGGTGYWSAGTTWEPVSTMKVTAQHKVRLWWLLVFFGGAVSLVLIPLTIRAGSGWFQYIHAVVPGVLALTLMQELRRLRKVRYASLAQAKSAVDHVMTEQRTAVTEGL